MAIDPSNNPLALFDLDAGLIGWDAAQQSNLEKIAAGGPIPMWRKYTVTRAMLAAAALVNDIELFSLPAGGVIHDVKQKHSAAFGGGSISQYHTSVGIASNLVKYAADFDVFQAPGNTVMQLTGTLGTENHGAATSIRIRATAVGANLNAATTGSVDVWVRWSVAA